MFLLTAISLVVLFVSYKAIKFYIKQRNKSVMMQKAFNNAMQASIDRNKQNANR